MDRLLAFSRRRRRRRWLALAGAGVGAYLVYHHPAVAARRRRIARVASALASLADAVAAVASDLAAFVRSDSDAIPPTVRQLSKLASSPEASASASALSGALTAGVLRGYAAAAASGPPSGDEVAFSDRLLDRILSPSGERLASAVAGSFGSQLVLAFYSAPSDPSVASSSPSWVDVVTTGSCRRAIRSWVEVFTATAVGVFIDKTIHINTYDQLIAAATNPSYSARLQRLLVALCNASMETLVKTSHSVLSNPNTNSISNRNGNDNGSGSGSGNNGGVREGWVETMSTALAVPCNRTLMLDLTGRATFEAVRSFLEFVLWRLHEGARAGGDAAIAAGLCALRYMSERSMVIAAICIALCLLVLNGTWLMARPEPASVEQL
ncbi:protein PHLOEM PROTEIN 2-LIKE A10-like [Oryza brachyantha]|uniref:protein PHLOEM PROTEIN 2-LIKE A10-like n=1 Tax=Oryza brachyantha TaxID=4533 RepID=UPI001ADD2F6F|nr:protein PHLOEM PROTEIN 2-LIKE A10-like [Oryza brachyantha]